MKNMIIVVLLGVIVWFGSVIVRLENYRYASLVGMCAEQANLVERDRCLRSKETRTSPFWHLAYALGFL